MLYHTASRYATCTDHGPRRTASSEGSSTRAAERARTRSSRDQRLTRSSRRSATKARSSTMPVQRATSDAPPQPLRGRDERMLDDFMALAKARRRSGRAMVALRRFGTPPTSRPVQPGDIVSSYTSASSAEGERTTSSRASIARAPAARDARGRARVTPATRSSAPLAIQVFPRSKEGSSAAPARPGATPRAATQTSSLHRAALRRRRRWLRQALEVVDRGGASP